MNNPIDKIKLQISLINENFRSFRKLTNDELRDKTALFEEKINNANNKSEILTEVLPEVYAIVKETARRFSQGRVVVTANDNDRRLAAGNCGFVEIDGDNAIYFNKWDAGGVPFVWDMVHYDEQLLGGILLHHGYAIEMATGEGKTLVATLPVFLNALTHQGVHLMTVNDYLSKRDYQLTHPIYAFHGLTVDCIEQYDTHERQRKNAYTCDITFGTNSGFVFDYLYDHLAIYPDDCVQGQHNFAIIDEIDSILIDDANIPHIISGGMPYNESEIYQKYRSLISEIVKEAPNDYYVVNNLDRNADFTDKGKAYISEKINKKELFAVRKKYEIEDFNTLPEKLREEILQNGYLRNVLHQLLLAYTVYEKDVDYVVQGGRVKIVDPNTGRIKERNRWEHGLHTAIEVKEEVEVRYDFNSMAVISLKNYFKLYNRIAGMSGTVMAAKDELQELYGLECAQVPTHRPVIREDSPLCIFRTSRQKDEAILNTVIENYNNGRPTLIGSLSIKRADAIERLLLTNELKFNRLDAKTTKDEALTVAKAGVGNTITLSTSVAGRGTDIKPSADALDNGGLCVIGADLFGSIRTDLQLRGRAGRQGNPGTSTFFASLEDVILRYLTKEEKKELDTVVSGMHGGDLSCDEVRHYFELAQTNRENWFKKKRAATARKDDMIAPRRAKFYKQRNNVLFNANYANELANEIVAESDDVGMGDVDSHLARLYPKVKELTQRSVRNNIHRRKILVPFSENLHPFAMEFDIDSILASEQNFISEFKRQDILLEYDNFWKEFVLYMMQDLDQKEIDALDDKCDRMIKDMHTAIVGKLISSIVIFDDAPATAEEAVPDFESPQAIADSKEVTTFDRLSLCPCGSGKKYCECHGGNIRNIRRRRAL